MEPHPWFTYTNAMVFSPAPLLNFYFLLKLVVSRQSIVGTIKSIP